jgi:ribosomal protein S3
MVFQEEDFKRTKVILSEYFDLENYLKKEYRFSLYDGRTIESPEQATEVNFYTQKDLLYGFFEALDQDKDHQLIEKVEDVV